LVVVSSKEERKKSLETVLWMAIWGCGLPACCCQPAVAGDVIYADLCGELSTHLAPKALFTQSSPVCEPLLQAFLFPSTLGEVTLHPLSQACVFIYSSCGKWVFPPSCGVSLPPPLLQAFPSWLLGVCCHSCLLQLSLFIYSSGKDSPPCPFWHSVRPTLFASCLYCSYCLLLSFSFFPGWGSVCPGGYAELAQGCLWEYRVLLSSPCGPRLPKMSGRWHLVVVLGPSWCLHLMWSGDAMHRLEVWRSQSFASSQWFFL
jgi:hypothetical protein